MSLASVWAELRAGGDGSITGMGVFYGVLLERKEWGWDFLWVATHGVPQSGHSVGFGAGF